MGGQDEQVKGIIGQKVWGILSECVRNGNINADHMKNIAYKLHIKVGGRHVNRVNKQTDWNELREVLGDWYTFQLHRLNKKEALTLLVAVFKSDEVDLHNISIQIEEVLGRCPTKCVHRDFFPKVAQVLSLLTNLTFTAAYNVLEKEFIDQFCHFDNWLEDHENLAEVIIKNPLKLVSSLKAIITHNEASAWPKEDHFELAKKMLLHKGLISKEDFCVLYRERCSENPGNFLPESDIWKFLVELGIAVSQNNSDSQIFIPCLINDDMMEIFLDDVKSIKNNENAVSFEYQLNENTPTVGIFDRLLTVIAREFLENGSGGGIKKAFRRDISKKQSGIIAGVSAVCRFNQELVEFHLLEFDSSRDCNNTQYQTAERGVRIHLLQTKSDYTCPTAAVKVMQRIDSVFSEHLTKHNT